MKPRLNFLLGQVDKFKRLLVAVGEDNQNTVLNEMHSKLTLAFDTTFRENATVIVGSDFGCPAYITVNDDDNFGNGRIWTVARVEVATGHSGIQLAAAFAEIESRANEWTLSRQLPNHFSRGQEYVQIAFFQGAEARRECAASSRLATACAQQFDLGLSEVLAEERTAAEAFGQAWERVKRLLDRAK